MARQSRDPALERQWRERVARWSTSGLSVRAFCRQHGLIETSFYSWKRELRARDAVVSAATGSGSPSHVGSPAMAPTKSSASPAQQGLPIARSTLCGWLAEAAAVLTPLWQVLKERELAADIVHTDDTPVPVQDPARDHFRTGRIWVYVSQHGIVYDATEDRSRDGPLAFLQGYQGFLQCDAYAGYDELFRRSHGTVIEVGCWAHVRRKFVDAERTSPREAHEAVARIKQLYAVEHEAKALDAAARRALRQEQAVPLLAALQTWLDHLAVTALPKSPLGEAVTYARNQWAALNVYVIDGRLAIDNNAAERGVKTTERDCTGKYRLFAGSLGYYSWDFRPAGSRGVAKPTHSGGNRMSESQKNSGKSRRRVVLLSS